MDILAFGANWRGASFFQIDSNVGVNWVSAEKFTIGQTRVITTRVQPMFIWRRPGLSFSPLATMSNTNTRLGTGAITADSITSQYLGRLSWTMPGPMRFSTLSLEGGQTHFHDGVLAAAKSDTRVAALWNVVWGYTRGGVP